MKKLIAITIAIMLAMPQQVQALRPISTKAALAEKGAGARTKDNVVSPAEIEVLAYPFGLSTTLASDKATTRTTAHYLDLDVRNTRTGMTLVTNIRGKVAGKHTSVTRRLISNLRSTIKVLQHDLKPGKNLPAVLALDIPIKDISRFRIKRVYAPEYSENGRRTTSSAISISLREDDTYEVNIRHRLLDESGLTKQQKAEIREVRMLLLRNAFDHIRQGANEEDILFRDCAYAATMPETRWRNLKNGLEGLSAEYMEGTHPYLNLLVTVRQFLRERRKEFRTKDMDIGALPGDLRLAIRKLSITNATSHNLARPAMKNLINYVIEKPGRSGRLKKAFPVVVKSSDSGTIEVKYSRYKGRMVYLKFKNLKANTLYKIIPEFNTIIGKWTFGLFELSHEDLLPVSCVAERYRVLDAEGPRFFSKWYPGSLIGDWVGAEIHGRKLPGIPKAILVATEGGTFMSLGSYKHEDEIVKLRLQSEIFIGKDVFEVEFNADTPYGLVATVYDVDKRSGERLGSFPIACLYYDFNKRKFNHVIRGGPPLPTIGRRATMDSIFGERTLLGEWPEPTGFPARCSQGGRLELSNRGTGFAGSSIFLNDAGFVAGKDYWIEASFSKQHGWIVKAYALNEDGNKVSYFPFCTHQLSLKELDGEKTRMPFVHEGWAKATMGPEILENLGEFFDLEELDRSQYSISTAKFSPAKQSILDLFKRRDGATLEAGHIKIMNQLGFTDIGPVLRKGKVTRLRLETGLSVGEYLRLEPIYSKEMGCWILFGFVAGVENLSDAELIIVWRVDEEEGRVNEVLLDPGIKRALLKELAGGFYSDYVDLIEVLMNRTELQPGLISPEQHVSDESRKTFEKMRRPLKHELTKYLRATLLRSKRALNHDELKTTSEVFIAGEKIHLAFPSIRFSLSLALDEWDALKDVFKRKGSSSQLKLIAEIDEIINPILKNIKKMLRFIHDDTNVDKRAVTVGKTQKQIEEQVVAILNNGHAPGTERMYLELSMLLDVLIDAADPSTTYHFIFAQLGVVQEQSLDGHRLKSLLGRCIVDDEKSDRGFADFSDEELPGLADMDLTPVVESVFPEPLSDKDDGGLSLPEGGFSTRTAGDFFGGSYSSGQEFTEPFEAPDASAVAVMEEDFMANVWFGSAA